MPTIAQLPSAAQAPSAADYIPIDQNVSGTFTTGKITLGSLLGLLASSNMLPPGVSSGSGAPSGQAVNGSSYINIANGDLWQYATGSGWTRVGSLVGPAGAAGAQGSAGPSYSITEQPTVTSMAGTDLVGISQGGADHTITLSDMLGGETINEGTAAGPASSSDQFWVAQSNNPDMVVQTIGALWPWLSAQLPAYFLPVIETTSNTSLDASVHNGKLLVCTQPVTLNAGGTMGSGFSCAIINSSNGSCTLSGFTATSSGNGTLSQGQSAIIYTAAVSIGTVYYAMIAGGASTPPPAPSVPTGLTVSATTSSTVSLSWTAPGSGGSPSGYDVQYQPVGATSWSNGPSSSGTSVQVTGLSPSTQYNFQVNAYNAGGTSAWSSTASGTTAAGAAPGTPTGLTVASETSSSVTLSWTAPSTGGSGASYNIQYELQSGGSWTQVSAGTSTSFTVPGLAASTAYNFQVHAVNGGLSSSWSSSVAGTTSASSGYVLAYTGTQSNNVPLSGATYTHGTGGIVAQINADTSSADGSYPVPAEVYFAWGTSSTTQPTTGFQSTSIYSTGGHNLYVLYLSAPASAGTYYLWAIAQNSASTVATFVWPSSFTIT